MGLGDLGVTKAIFGSGSSPGVMGTGQQRFPQSPVGNTKKDANGNTVYQMPADSKRAEAYLNGTDPGDPVYEEDPYKAWQDPQADARRAQLNAQTAKYEGRAAPTMGAAQTDLNALERTQGATIGNAERFGGVGAGNAVQGQQAQLGNAERVGNINIGQAQGYGGAQVDPAAQARAAQLSRQDAQFRAGQTGLMSQLQEQAAGRGPSLAEGQLRSAAERNISQQAGLAAAQGGNPALAQRNLSMEAANVNQKTASDAAQMRIQEQLAARQQLAGVAQTGREQDINVANAQAQLQQQTALANQAALNSRSAQQAGLSQQAGLFTAGAMNDRQLQQAQLNAQLSLANQGAGNQFALQQGQFGQQMSLANMAAQNQQNQFNAGQYQQAGLANQQYANQFALQQANLNQQSNLANQQYYNQGMFGNTGYQQQANQANLQANLQQQSLNDAMSRYFTEAGLGLDARQQQAMMGYQGLQQQANLGYGGLSQRGYEGAREGIGGFMSGIGQAFGAVAGSDEEIKQSVTRGEDKIGDFLNQYMNGIEHLSSEYQLPEKEQHSSNPAGALIGKVGSKIATSDEKAKDLSAENSKLKSTMTGIGMAIGGGRNNPQAQQAQSGGFFGGMAPGLKTAADAKPNSFVKPVDISNTNTNPIMNNPNAAIAMPGGTAMPGGMSPTNLNGTADIQRQNPYGFAAPQQTWSASQMPVYNPPAVGNMDITHIDPNDTQTWSDKNVKSYSPAGMKQGITSGNMQISNFLNTLKGAGANPISGPASAAFDQSSFNNPLSEMSDEKTKIANFLDKQHAYEYEYKPEYKDLPGAGEGRYVSPMAQDLQKTDLGKSMVKPGPDGKLQVDYGKGFGTLLASQAFLNERLNELESKKGKK